MEKVLIAFISRMPDWAVGLGSLFILAGLAYVLVALGRGANRFAAVLDKEQRLHDLLARVYAEESKRKQSDGLALQLQTTVAHLGLFIGGFGELRQDLADAEGWGRLVGQIIESLASDLTHSSGEVHRCGLWLNVEPESLVLVQPSSGFPPSYAWQRRLDVNNSVAGRAFRKNKEEVIPDVSQDPDFLPNPESHHGYRSMLCIPLRYSEQVSGILTVDGRLPFSEHEIEISRAYSQLTSMVFAEMLDRMEDQRQTTKP